MSENNDLEAQISLALVCLEDIKKALNFLDEKTFAIVALSIKQRIDECLTAIQELNKKERK